MSTKKKHSPNSEHWNPEQRRCIDALAWVFGGHHHLPKLGEAGPRGVEMVTFRDFSTFDCNTLTEIVLIAHARAVRIEIGARNMKYLRIFAHAREHDETKRRHERHPELSQLIAAAQRMIEDNRQDEISPDPQP